MSNVFGDGPGSHLHRRVSLEFQTSGRWSVFGPGACCSCCVLTNCGFWNLDFGFWLSQLRGHNVIVPLFVVGGALPTPSPLSPQRLPSSSDPALEPALLPFSFPTPSRRDTHCPACHCHCHCHCRCRQRAEHTTGTSSPRSGKVKYLESTVYSPHTRAHTHAHTHAHTIHTRTHTRRDSWPHTDP